jgi:hypothetical protein
MIESSFLFLFCLILYKRKAGAAWRNSRAEYTVRREILQAVQSNAPRPDCCRPGDGHSAAAEILTQQTAKDMSHCALHLLFFVINLCDL